MNNGHAVKMKIGNKKDAIRLLKNIFIKFVEIVSTISFAVSIYLALGRIIGPQIVDESRFSLSSWPQQFIFIAAWMGVPGIILMFVIAVVFPLIMGYLITRLGIQFVNKMGGRS